MVRKLILTLFSGFAFQVKSYGFKDCWFQSGRPSPVKTCRFGTHIDYVYANDTFLSQYKYYDSKLLHSYLLALVYLILCWLLWAEIECTGHTAHCLFGYQ